MAAILFQHQCVKPVTCRPSICRQLGWSQSCHLHVMLFTFKEIFIYCARLQKIHSDALCGIRNLLVLRLPSNKLTTPPDLYAVKHTLRMLHLNGNYLKQFPINYFRNAVHLYDIDLSNNYLIALPEFHWIEKSLASIHMTKNFIVTLDPLTARGRYDSLSTINANGNDIIYFNVTHLKNMPNLKNFALGNNNLTSLGDVTLYFNGTLTMDLDWNPWHCDVTLSWLRGLNLMRTALTCLTPYCCKKKVANNLSEYLCTIW